MSDPRQPIHVHSGKRTKIVCTVGPSCKTVAVKRRMIQAGANVFRLNFSHGTHEDHADSIAQVRALSLEMGCAYALLADLSGPKLRLGEVPGGQVSVKEGDRIVLTSGTAGGEEGRFPVNFSGFHEVARAGHTILLDDGNVRLTVESIEGQDVRCRVENSAPIKSRKGVNLPDTPLPIPALTPKDERDLEFALSQGIDVVALSFVRRPEDIESARAVMRRCKREVPILAKIEKKEAIENLEAILEAADGAMVARGDLGIEIPMEKVPGIQKRIIRLCNQMAKPVITATQMLESMISSPRPTRAEVADIYNAIQDGTDAIMLSAETAAGSYPVEAVEAMETIAVEAERGMAWNKSIDWVTRPGRELTITDVVCNSAVMCAERLNLDLIIVPTQSGFSAFQLSRFKPRVPVFACSGSTSVVNRLCLAWGVQARLAEPLRIDELQMSATDAVVKAAIRCARSHGFARPGMRVVVLGGTPNGRLLTTNHLRVEVIE